MTVLAELQRIADALEKIAAALTRPRRVASVEWLTGTPTPEKEKTCPTP